MGLDAGGVRLWVAACVRGLDAHRADIDQINVFPVADGDTGSNMLGTMRAALEGLLRARPEEREDVGAVFAVLARSALAGARGNSGVIVSQVLRGMAEALAGCVEVDAASFRAALVGAAGRAREAVAEPVPGTMLTVLEAAAAVPADGDLVDVARAAAEAAVRALAETPRELDVLAEAGVVDAGGRGVVVLLNALVSVLTGEDVEAPATRVPVEHALVREGGSSLFAYEVMYLLERTTEGAVTRLRDTLSRLGDCVSVVGDGSDLWTVHVHCNDIGAAIEAGVEAGRPRRIRVARFADAVPEVPARFVRDRAVVACVRGDELAEVLLAEGVTVLRVPAEPHELVRAIAGTGAAHVTVLPGHASLVGLADEAAIRAVAAGQDVVVVPCVSPVQVLSAIAVHDPRRRAGDDVVGMAEAAAATRRGEVVVAEEAAITWVGTCAAGDLLGFVDGEVVRIQAGPSTRETVARAACAVAERMLATGGELVTALLGRDAPEGVADDLVEHLRRVRPDADVVVHRGGQPDSVLALGVE